MKRSAIALCLLIILVFSVPKVFAQTSLLTLKWEITLPTKRGHFHPSMGDVDNDGTQEIVIDYGNSVHVLNGKTGALEWASPQDGSWESTILELADLNKDGIPEIIYCGSNLSVYARDGHGELLWKSNRVNGEYWSGTSIVTQDINGDGYPEIYVTTDDTSIPYTGCITKLDSSGNILATSEITYKSCWGGLAMADANFDGKFEIYLGDRSKYGGPGGRSNSYPDNPARGLTCYDAETLELIWIRDDLSHSTPAPVLIDVTGDGTLEVIANNILNNGAVVINAITGEDIYNWKRTPINNHAKGTVWDIDLDGHIELISAWGYVDSTRCTKDFTVLDLVTGEIDYRASEINNWISYPPTVGDVTGDGLMEILVTTSGEYGHGEVGQGMFYIYDHNYEILQIINDFTYDIQLWEPYCVDSDSDGFNEVLIGNNRGQLWCYDTPAKTPQPPPKPWSAWYSPYRQGASINVQTQTPPPFIRRSYDLNLGDQEYEINIETNSDINFFVFDPTLQQIGLQVEGNSETASFCKITIPENLLLEDFSVYLDDVLLLDDIDYTISYNVTHNIFHINYYQGSHMIKLGGTDIISEFPTGTIPTLFLILAIVAIIIRKKLSKPHS